MGLIWELGEIQEQLADLERQRAEVAKQTFLVPGKKDRQLQQIDQEIWTRQKRDREIRELVRNDRVLDKMWSAHKKKLADEREKQRAGTDPGGPAAEAASAQEKGEKSRWLNLMRGGPKKEPGRGGPGGR